MSKNTRLAQKRMAGLLFLAALCAAPVFHAADADPGIRKKLQDKKVTFEFVDATLADAVEFMRKAADVPITIDPAVSKQFPPRINLKVTDMKADVALDWIMKMVELEYRIDYEDVFVSTPEGLKAAKDRKPEKVEKVEKAPGK